MNNKIEIKSCQATRDLFIKGYASVFNQADSHGDIITKAAFTDAMNPNNGLSRC